jgi:hypothetical protein
MCSAQSWRAAASLRMSSTSWRTVSMRQVSNASHPNLTHHLVGWWVSLSRDAKSGRPGARGVSRLPFSSLTRKVEGDAAASVQVGGTHAAATEESWQDRARPKPLLAAETRGSGDPCLESPLSRSCWPPGHWMPGYVEVHPKRTERKQWSDSGGGVSLTPSVRSRTRQWQLLQPCELLQLADAAPGSGRASE